MVKLVDVARIAGVSKAAVSYAFSADPVKRSKLSAATLERILLTAENLKYRPSMVGRGLSLGRTFSIALLLPEHCARNISPHNLGMFHGVSTVISASDYNLLVFFGCSKRFLADLAQHRFDGVMMISKLAEAQAIKQIAECKVPFVLLGRTFPAEKLIGSTGSDFGAFAEKFLQKNQDLFPKKLRIYCRKSARLAVDMEVIEAVQTAARRYGVETAVDELDDFRELPQDTGAAVFRSVTPAVECFLQNSQLPAAVWTGKRLSERSGMLQCYHDSFNIGIRGSELLLDMISGTRSGENILVGERDVHYKRGGSADYKLDF